MISGILVSPGFAFGQALILKEDPIVVSTKKLLTIRLIKKLLALLRVVTNQPNNSI